MPRINYQPIIKELATEMGLSTTDLNRIQHLLTPEKKVHFSMGFMKKVALANDKLSIKELCVLRESHNATIREHATEVLELTEQHELNKAERFLSKFGL